MKNLYMRAYSETTVEADGPIRFVASTEGEKRDGLSIDAGAWNLDNYRRNPVFLWVHDYMGRNLPIGRADVRMEEGKLLADVVFDRDDPFAAQVERKYRAGFLNAVSVGWNILDYTPARGKEPPRITRADLLDLSAVPVPGDPDALMERAGQGARSVAEWLSELGNLTPDPSPAREGETRGAVAPHSTRKAADDAQLDEVSARRELCAWSDGDRCELLHHLETGEVVWAGVAAGMARLLSDGAGIPEEERQGAYVHLERHYRQFGRTAPEYLTPGHLYALTLAEIRGLFLEGEEQYVDAGCTGNGDSADMGDGAGTQASPYEDLYASLLKGLAGRMGR